MRNVLKLYLKWSSRDFSLICLKSLEKKSLETQSLFM